VETLDSATTAALRDSPRPRESLRIFRGACAHLSGTRVESVHPAKRVGEIVNPNRTTHFTNALKNLGFEANSYFFAILNF
jgi:hypothetical protein